MTLRAAAPPTIALLVAVVAFGLLVALAVQGIGLVEWF